MQLPEFPRFSNLTLEHKPLFDSLLKGAQPQISELTFTNLFVWNASEPVQTSQFDETVLIQRRRLRDGKTFLLPPLGKKTLFEVLTSLRSLSFEGELPPFYGFSPQQVQQVENEFARAGANARLAEIKVFTDCNAVSTVRPRHIFCFRHHRRNLFFWRVLHHFIAHVLHLFS